MRERDILEKAGCSDSVIRHCIAVSKKASKIGNNVSVDVDLELIRLGALFHDIGRCRSHGLDHGVVGAEIAKDLGFSNRVVDIIERHIGAGISEEESESLGLPRKDYTPRSPEEKIVSYVDSLTFGTRYVSFDESLGKFEKILGKDHQVIEKFRKLHLEIHGWMNG